MIHDESQARSVVEGVIQIAVSSDDDNDIVAYLDDLFPGCGASVLDRLVDNPDYSESLRAVRYAIWSAAHVLANDIVGLSQPN